MPRNYYDTTTEHDCKTVLRRVTAYGRKPRTAGEALVQAHALLSEEGRWIKDSLLDIKNAQKMYDDPTCGSWGCCAAGSIQTVTTDVNVKVCKTIDNWDGMQSVDYEIETSLDDIDINEIFANDPRGRVIYRNAMIYLMASIKKKSVQDWIADTLNRRLREPIIPSEDKDSTKINIIEDRFTIVFNFNDAQTRKRDDVLDVFANAIELARTERLPKWLLP